MKLIKHSKQIITSIVLGFYALTVTPNVYADNNDASDPIAQMAKQKPETNTNTDTDNNDNDQDMAKPLTKQSQDAIANMLLQSVSLMGIAYKWGGNSPSSGMDCSGFIRYVYQKSLGISLPRTAAEQARVGKKVSIDNLEPGDLMFFNSRRGSNTHVGMYLGNNKFIQSPRTGENIQISDFSGNWRKNFNGAKRIVQKNSAGTDDAGLENLQGIRDEALPVTHRASPNQHGRGGRVHGKKSNKRDRSSVKKSTGTKSTVKSTSKSSKKTTTAKKKKST